MKARLSRRAFTAGAFVSLTTLMAGACAAAPGPATPSIDPGSAPAGGNEPPAPTVTPRVPAPPAARPKTSADATELVILLRALPGQLDFFSSLGRAFTSQNPSVDVRVIGVPDDFAQTRKARLAAGTAGDAALSTTQHNLPLEARIGVLRPIDEYANRDKYDLKQHLDGAIRAATLDGTLYGLPWNAHPGWSAVYYQPELFRAAGLETPTVAWNYDDLARAAVRLTLVSNDTVQQYGLWIAPFQDAVQTPVRAFGGEYLNEAGTAARFDEAATGAGLQWVADAYARWHFSPPSPSYDSRISWWTTRRLAMVLSGYWENVELAGATARDMGWAVAPAPIGPGGRGAVLSASLFPIWASSRNAEQAWEWQKYLASRQVGLANYNVDLPLGARADVWEDARVQRDPMIAPYTELIRDATPAHAPANGRVWELAAAVDPLLRRAWAGEQSVSDTATALQTAASQVLAMAAPARDL